MRRICYVDVTLIILWCFVDHALLILLDGHADHLLMIRWCYVDNKVSQRLLNNRKAGYLNETDIMKCVWVFLWRRNCHNDMYKCLGDLCRKSGWNKDVGNTEEKAYSCLFQHDGFRPTKTSEITPRVSFFHTLPWLLTHPQNINICEKPLSLWRNLGTSLNRNISMCKNARPLRGAHTMFIPGKNIVWLSWEDLDLEREQNSMRLEKCLRSGQSKIHCGKSCRECFNSRATGTLYRRTQGSSVTGLESSWANQRARCFTWSQKLAWQRKLLRETDAILSESQLAMLRKEALVAISCNISSSPRLIDVAFFGCACCAEGHVGRHTRWLESVQDAFKQTQESR